MLSGNEEGRGPLTQRAAQQVESKGQCMRRLKVIFLPNYELDSVWCESIIAALSAHHELITYDKNKPLEEQFADVEAVVDTGGAMGTHEMMDAAKKARLWQIVGTGLDHVDIAYEPVA